MNSKFLMGEGEEPLHLERTAHLEARINRLESKIEVPFSQISKSKAMDSVHESLAHLRRESLRNQGQEAHVLVLGESGTEKDVIARTIHASSRRGKGAWITFNCAQFDEARLEIELFGEDRKGSQEGSQTRFGVLELAKGGTLFLERVENLSPKLQSLLYRALSESVFYRLGGETAIRTDVRVIADGGTGSSLDLRTSVKKGFFNADLFRVLSGVEIQVPPLRERADDILRIATHFAQLSFKEKSKVFLGFSQEAEKALTDFSWPGNFYELKNVIERSALTWKSGTLVSAEALGFRGVIQAFLGSRGSQTIGPPALQLVSSQLAASGSTPPLALSDQKVGVGTSYTDLKRQWSDSFEREYLVVALNRNGGNVSSAAREAKLDRSNFLRLLRRHGLHAEEFRPEHKKAA